MNVFDAMRLYPHRALTFKMDQDYLVDVFNWCFENLQKPACYNLKANHYSVVDPTRRWTQRLWRTTNETILPRKQFFRFKSDDDRVLFRVRWA